MGPRETCDFHRLIASEVPAELVDDQQQSVRIGVGELGHDP
ncbi:hypothetical protein [Kocuria arenosa]